MSQRITAQSLLTPSGEHRGVSIEVDEGQITSIDMGMETGSVELLSPAFFDIHVHGAVSHDFMSAGAAQMDAVGAFLARKGVGHYLATTVTAKVDSTLQSLARLAAYMRQGSALHAARMVGIHLEGPFLCPAKRGVHPLDRILAPSIELFERFQEAAEGHIKLVTLAPEIPGALPLIEHMTAHGVAASLGHSNATYAEALAGMQAGAKSATHTFNAMRAIDHREPGLAAAVLDQQAGFAELIADGVHVHPAMVRLWLKAKGDRRAILVTDGMAAAGMPDGTYHLGDLVVDVREGVCLSGGVLAGSVLTMDRAVSNLRAMTGASLATAVRLASHNPAEMLGMQQVCDIRVGAAANFNIYDSDGQRLGMWLNGVRIPA